MAERLDIELEQGARFNKAFQWLDENKDPKDITGYDALMQIRESKDKDSRLIAEVSTVGGGISINGSQGIVRPDIKSNVTEQFDFTWAWYDILIWFVDYNNAVRLVEGKIKLNKQVSIQST